MKRFVILLTAMMLAIPGVFAGPTVTADHLFKQFKSSSGAISISVNPVMMSFVKLFSLGTTEGKILRKIKSVKILDLSDCSDTDKQSIASTIDNNGVKNMEPLVAVTDDGENVMVMAESDGNRFKKLLVFVNSPDDCCLIQINGNFTFDELHDVVNSQTKRNK